MKTVEDFLTYLRTLDIQLWSDGDRLRYSAPEGKLIPSLRTELADRKAEILEFLRNANRTNSSTSLPLQTFPRTQDLALSSAQQRLWFLDQLEPSSSAYNMPYAYRFKGQLNVIALEQSLREIVQRHEVLRTTFATINGQPIQVIATDLNLTRPVVDLLDLPENEREAEEWRRATEQAQRPFDLAHGPLLRLELLRIATEEHLLVVNMHHIISDGWSIGVFEQELAALYQAFCQGKPSPLPELPIQYADFAQWQQQWLQSEEFESQLDYWKQQLGGSLPVLELPTDRPRPPVPTDRGEQQSLLLPKNLSEALKALSRQERVTLAMTLLATFKVLLYRYTGQEDILVGSPIAGRNRAELEGLIGFFISTLVLRTNLSGNISFRELLGRVREVTLGAYANQDVPFEKLVEELQPERDLSRNPIFQVWFNMLNLEDKKLELPELKVEAVSIIEERSKFDLTLYVQEQKEGIQLKLVYKADLFETERMAEMLAQFQHLLMQIVEDPEARITEFSLVTTKAKVILPNPTQIIDCQWEGAVHTRFTQQAQRIPDKVAVVDAHESWSYAQLDARSNQLAHYLLAHGISSQDIVAIYGHRSASLVWTILGVAKAGAAFVIIDPAYPVSRLTDCLDLAQPRGWLQLEAAGELPTSLEKFVDNLSCCCRLRLPQNSPACQQNFLVDYSTEDPEVVVDPDNLLYVTFTSGSTGVPKGILGTHRPLSHFLSWHSQKFGLNQSDRFSMLSGLSHDPLLRDIFTPLWLGATLCIPDQKDIERAGQLVKWMQEQQISIAHLTPAMGRLLTETIPVTANATNETSSLRYAFFGGDVLTRQDVTNISKLSKKVTCVNCYGATETPQVMGYFIVPKFTSSVQDSQITLLKEKIALGQGIADVQLLLLNTNQQLAGIGELGEIHVRTPYLSKGYVGNEQLTKERFIINPFTQIANDRLYKTGDLARYLPDGNIEFLGRVDNQVKIRGFRIELGEIQTVLTRHPDVRETVVIAREDQPGDKRLVAYVVAVHEQAPTTKELRHFLEEKLPNYMVPSAFVVLDMLPLTPNGKVDYRALPAPALNRNELEETFVAPQDELERQLTKIWEKVLGIQPIGRQDNFFELGGHSLLAVRLFAKIEELFGKNLPLVTLFQAPTIEQLASTIRNKSWLSAWSSLVPIRASGSKPPLFCIHGGGFNVLIYHDLANYLGPDYPVYGLQAQGLDGNTILHGRYEDMAADYIKHMRTVQPEGPYFLAGVSAGGNIGLEMAHQLQAQGQKVALLAMFDTHGPENYAKVLPPIPRLFSVLSYVLRYTLPRFVDKHMQFGFQKLLTQLMAEIANFAKSTNSEPNSEFTTELPKVGGKITEGDEYFHGETNNLERWVHNFHMRIIKRSQLAYGAEVLEVLGQGGSFADVVEKLKENQLKARLNYKFKPYSGRITAFRAKERLPGFYQDPQFGWGKIAVGGLEIYDMPGYHADIVKSRAIAEQMRVCIDKASS
ncbi:MAG: amino acid adenylation domain-containing protein [Coleofasciculaceae cyanobacterium]